MFNETMSWSQVGDPGEWGELNTITWVEEETKPLTIAGLKALYHVLKRKTVESSFTS